MLKTCNAVFEGGGVRGIGHVGAVCRMEQEGWQFADTAGSSAGAIVAALLAAGYTGKELKKELETLDYMKFKGMDLPDHFGIMGKSLSLLLSLGIYHTDELEDWIDELLNRKGMRRFGDVERSGRRLKITASDLTERRLLVFPDDLKEFVTEPGEFCIAPAVRMSVSIPIFRTGPLERSDRERAPGSGRRALEQLPYVDSERCKTCVNVSDLWFQICRRQRKMQTFFMR